MVPDESRLLCSHRISVERECEIVCEQMTNGFGEKVHYKDARSDDQYEQRQKGGHVNIEDAELLDPLLDTAVGTQREQRHPDDGHNHGHRKGDFCVEKFRKGGRDDARTESECDCCPWKDAHEEQYVEYDAACAVCEPVAEYDARRFVYPHHRACLHVYDVCHRRCRHAENGDQ